MGDRILGQVGSGMNVQLLHDAGLVEFHRFHRHLEGRGNRLCAAALSDKLQDFPLARGEAPWTAGLPRSPEEGLSTESSTSFVIRRGQIVLTVED